MKNELLPDFRIGEAVIVMEASGSKLAEGKLETMTKGRFGSIEVVVSGECFSLSSYAKDAKVILSASRFSDHMARETLIEMSDVADKFLIYARSALTKKEIEHAQTLVHELLAIASHAAERSESKKGVSASYMQGMYGNHALDHDAIQSQIAKSAAEGCKNIFWSHISDMACDDEMNFVLSPGKKSS